MNNRQLIAVLVALGLVAVGVVFKYNSNNAGEDSQDVQKMSKVLPSFPLNEITAIQIKTKKAEVNLARTGERWGVKERDGYPANFDFVRQLAKDAWDLKVVDSTKIGKNQLGRLHLIDPTSEEAKNAADDEVGTLIVFKKDGDQEVARLLLGKEIQSADAGDNPFFAMSGAAGRFVQAGGKTDVAYKVKEPFSSLNVEPKEWVDKAFISPSGALKSMEVKVSDPADQSWKVDREKEGGDMVLADKKEGENVDPEKVKQASNGFSSAYFSDVAAAADKEKTGIDNPKRTATVTYFDGFSYTIKVGNKVKPEDENSEWYIAVTPSYTPKPEPVAPTDAAPTEPAPTPAPAGETEEQKKEREKKDADAKTAYEEAKKRFDDAKRKYEEDVKAWEADKKAKEERLAKEKAYEGSVYTVSKYTVDWLTKDRKYFLKDEAAAPAAPASPLPTGTLLPPSTPGASAVTPPIAVPPAGDKPKRIEAVTPPVSIEIPPKAPMDDKKPEPLIKPAPEAPKPEAPAPAPAAPKPETPKVEPPAGEAPKADEPKPAPAPEPAAPADPKPAEPPPAPAGN